MKQRKEGVRCVQKVLDPGTRFAEGVHDNTLQMAPVVELEVQFGLGGQICRNLDTPMLGKGLPVRERDQRDPIEAMERNTPLPVFDHQKAR